VGKEKGAPGMSYFVCGFKADAGTTDAFEKILVDLVPSHIRTDRLRVEGKTSCLAAYGNKKVIQNLTIRNDKQGSWLVLMGTPLVRLTSEDQRLAFFEDFLNNPTDSLCHKIDGNFAAFSYDAPRDRFIAATDFNNTIPIFYALTPNGVLFTSHELALAKFLNPEIDSFGFSQSIYLGVTWGSFTRFQGIHKMQPCQIFFLDKNKGLSAEYYWRPEHEARWSGTFEDQREKWMSLLKESVWKFYECSDYKPVIADFTAGEDTRLILAQCHALGIPFKAQVTGLASDIDVIVAKRAAKEIGFDLMEREKHWITEEQLLTNASTITLDSDAYQELFTLCTEFATDKANPLDDYGTVKYCGVPGGEAFRGSYYLRGKALFPSKGSGLDYKFFTKMKYLLDYQPGLLSYSDDDFLRGIQEMVEDSLVDVEGLPIGTQIDHLIRVFQTCFLGLKYKNPLYLPLATNRMTRSIYGLSPRYKRGGRLTKACTEILFPDLAFIKTQNGVPTIRKTVWRLPLFMPEYISVIRKISSGATSRLFKLRQANKWYYRQDLNAYILTTLLNRPPYCNWFSSSQAMITGHLYDRDALNSKLEEAKSGRYRWLPILGRIINQELAFRWVYGEGLASIGR
jgi:hypothetical protein